MKENNNQNNSNNRLPAIPLSRLPAIPLSRLPAIPLSRIASTSSSFFEHFTTLRNTESRWNAVGFTKKN